MGKINVDGKRSRSRLKKIWEEQIKKNELHISKDLSRDKNQLEIRCRF